MSRFSDKDIAALDHFFDPKALTQATPPNPQYHRGYIFRARSAGVVVTPEVAFEVSTVWACCEAIVKPMSSQPVNIFAQLPNGDRDQLFNEQAGYLLNRRANPEMNAVSAREAIALGAVAFGGGYAEIEWDRSNRPIAIWPIHPERVEPRRDDKKRLVYHINNDLAEPSWLYPEDMIHVHGIGLSGLVGRSIISQASHTIALAIAAERFAEAYFGNNTQMGGVLRYPNKLDDPTYDRLKEEFDESHAGPYKAHRPLILDQGGEWEQLIADGRKSQMNESRQAQVIEICRWFGVPPHKVADLTRSTNNNIEHQGLEFTRDALHPWAVRHEQEIDYKLLDVRGRERFCKIDLEPLSQGDAVSRSQYYSAMRNIGVYSANDILKMEGKNTIGAEGDIRIVNGACTRLEDVGKNYPQTGVQQEPADTSGDGEAAADTGGALVQNTFRAMFKGFFDRVEQRRAAREADLRANSTDVDAKLRQFAAQQIGALSDTLRKPCESVSAIAGHDVFAYALDAGHRVASGSVAAEDAADEVIKHAFGDKA